MTDAESTLRTDPCCEYQGRARTKWIVSVVYLLARKGELEMILAEWLVSHSVLYCVVVEFGSTSQAKQWMNEWMHEWVLGLMVLRADQSCLQAPGIVAECLSEKRESPWHFFVFCFLEFTASLFHRWVLLHIAFLARKLQNKNDLHWRSFLSTEEEEWLWPIIMPQLVSVLACPLPHCLSWLLLESFLVGSLHLTKDKATLHETVKNSQSNCVLRRVTVTCFFILSLLVVYK